MKEWSCNAAVVLAHDECLKRCEVQLLFHAIRRPPFNEAAMLMVLDDSKV